MPNPKSDSQQILFGLGITMKGGYDSSTGKSGGILYPSAPRYKT